MSAAGLLQNRRWSVGALGDIVWFTQRTNDTTKWGLQ
jgi:hypothetical protein